MGAWGTGPFENDEASDWASSLACSSADELAMTLEAAARTGDPNLHTCHCGLAAAELVAAARGYPCPRLPREVSDWIRENAFHCDRATRILAEDAVANIRSDSALSHEYKGDGGWTRRTKNLLDRLARPSRISKSRATRNRKNKSAPDKSPSGESGSDYRKLVLELRSKGAIVKVAKSGEIKEIDLSDSERFSRSDFAMLSKAVTAVDVAIGTEGYQLADLRHLAKLKQLRSLSLESWSDPFTDSHAKQLAKFRLLEELELLGSSEIRDEGLGHLSQLSSLQSLRMRTEHCTKRGLAAFHRRLPKCEIHKPYPWTC
ncbi:MAG: DUF4259 domain-containing protein [Planctomycetaceae bacterium]|nr:DUF4259 domain-containing protein [Planctomycetales bacterium]MCB9926443.1 DUF4259 domain-containing protein [Planctomycetaceae bacterium]